MNGLSGRIARCGTENVSPLWLFSVLIQINGMLVQEARELFMYPRPFGEMRAGVKVFDIPAVIISVDLAVTEQDTKKSYTSSSSFFAKSCLKLKPSQSTR